MLLEMSSYIIIALLVVMLLYHYKIKVRHAINECRQTAYLPTISK